MSLLRPYQRQAIDACWEHITPEVNRVAVEMATGLGKTITFAALIDEWLTNHKAYQDVAWTTRALVLVHTDELVRQAVDKIKLMTGGRWSIGVVKAGENEVSADIIVASVQTLAQPGRREQIQDVGLIVVDECHHATAKTYTDILRWFGSMGDHACAERPCWDCRDTGFTSPPIPTFGFTATLARSDGQGLGHVWQDLAFSRSLLWGMRHGYLIDVVPYSILIPGVNGKASDAALDAQLADSIAPEAVVQAWLGRATDAVVNPPAEPPSWHPSTMLFAPLVKSAEAFADAFNAAGIKSEVVAGVYGRDHNRAVRARYETGVTTMVCNAMMWTEGVDVPRTECVVIARPTRSKPLLIQMTGRGVRPWLAAEAPPREDQRCTLLVVAGADTEFLDMVADLSDSQAEGAPGKSFLRMADEWDIGKDLDVLEESAYRGPVRVEQWDALVQRSSKAWKYTDGGVPFLPLRKRSEAYVMIVQAGADFEVWTRWVMGTKRVAKVLKLASAPDLELAMALAEDEAQERGGDIGSLLADKTRPWRKAVPSAEMLAQARRVGIDESAIARILASKSAGKAGRLSDLIDKVMASHVLDRTAIKIKERASA